MRKQDKVILWSVYFDSTRTRSEGRKVPKRLAVPTPKLSDIQTAVEKTGLKCDVVAEAAYPGSPWRRIGYVSVSKEDSKNNLLKKVAQNLLHIHPE